MSSERFSSAFVVTLLLSHAVLAPLTVIAQEQDASPQQVQEKNNSSLNESVSKNSSEISGDTSQDSVAQESNQTVTENIDMSEVPDESVDSETANETTSKAVSGDWEYTDDGIYRTITKYTGSATDIVIPTEIDGKPTKLRDITKEIFPNYASITSFSVFPSADGRKVPLVTKRIGGEIFSKSAFDADWGKLSSIDLSGLDVSSLIDTYKMFQDCRARSITLPDFSSGNVIDMDFMFENAYPLTNLKGLSSFNTSNVTSMRSTFRGTTNLENIDVSHFDTSKVVDMGSMFSGSRTIKKLDLRNFNTSKVTNMSNMFNGCVSLTDLNVTSFDTSNVLNMGNMFLGTPSLTVIDLSSFKINSAVAPLNWAIFSTSYGDSSYERPLIIIATDPFFFSYQYNRDKRTMPQILLNANGGNYVNGKTQLNYFTSCAIRPEETSLDKLKEFKQNNLPTKTGFLFNGYTTTTDTSQATSVLDLIGTVYDAQWKARTISLEVPTAISFGTHKLSRGTNYYSVDSVEGKQLSVTDDRGVGSKWQLTAKLQAPLTNNGKTLPNSLVYKTDAGEETITENVSQVIATHITSTDSEKTTISDGWTNDQGLMLKLEEGKAAAGEYSTTIEWTLNDAP